MQSELIASMRDQVRTIYRVVTGSDMPESQASGTEREAPVEEVTRSFAELEALMRTTPGLAERIPPFSFTPALDALFEGNDLIVEVAVPGVEREHVAVECVDGTLVISGIRRGHGGAGPASYSHGEIPYGPFYRTFHVPFPTCGEPAVDLDRGLLRVRLKSAAEGQQEEQTAEGQISGSPK